MALHEWAEAMAEYLATHTDHDLTAEDVVENARARCRHLGQQVPVRMFTADEVVEIANETSDWLGNLYRLDFIRRIQHEAAVDA